MYVRGGEGHSMCMFYGKQEPSAYMHYRVSERASQEEGINNVPQYLLYCIMSNTLLDYHIALIMRMNLMNFLQKILFVVI